MKRIGQRLKVLVKAALGRELLVRPDVSCEHERFGSEYGGWDVVVTGLNAGSVVYSVGVGEDASFDVSLSERFGLTVHAFDPTPKSIAWVETQGLPDAFVMHGYGIAAHDGEVSFHPPENPAHVSHTMLDRPATRKRAITVPVKTLGTIMRELGHDHIDVLKMDIEGAEYEVVEDIARSAIRPGQMLIEFHHRFPGVGITRTKDAIARIRSIGYRLFSVSPTNEEYGFIRWPG